MSDTPRLAMPYLSSSQAQKETTHNESLVILYSYAQTAVESAALTAPPNSLTEGNLYIVGTSATDAWAGYDNYLAQYIGSAWVFYSPFSGMRAWDKATPQALVYKSSAWVNELTAAAKIGFFDTTPVTQTIVTMSNTDGAISGLTISTTYSQTEVEALRDACETLAHDVRALKTALASYGLV